MSIDSSNDMALWFAVNRLYAAALRLPFLPTRSGLGSEVTPCAF